MSGLASPANDVQIHGEDHDDAGDDRLPLLRDRHDPQAVREGADDERPDDGPKDRALTAAQGRAADDDRRDRVELVAEAQGRLRGVDPGPDEDAAETREHPAEGVHRRLPRCRVHA